jgi:hypothetical protein
MIVGLAAEAQRAKFVQENLLSLSYTMQTKALIQ